MNNSYIFTDFNSLSLSINNKAYNVDSTHQNWTQILDAIKADNFDIIPNLINLASAVKEYVNAGPTAYRNIEVNDEYGSIRYAGEDIHTTIVDHIFRMKDQGFPITPMLKFLDNLLDNPSKRAVNELYGFLQYGKMPVTEDGCFLAYKRVRDDYKSVHDGKTDNSIGATVSMPRNLVNENSHETCSTGLHFCSFEYLKSFSGSKIVVLKVNPRDVVSIPNDYNNTKGRACRYEVVGELTADDFHTALERNIFTEAVRSETGDKVEVPVPTPVATATGKAGKGPFYEGYSAGYDDGLRDPDGNGDEYDDTNVSADYDWKQVQAYEEGYCKGYDDGADKNPRAYVLVKDARGTGAWPFPVGTAAVRPAVSKAFADAYADGYKAGRNKKRNCVNDYFHDAYDGYGAGFADGKARMPKLY